VKEVEESIKKEEMKVDSSESEPIKAELTPNIQEPKTTPKEEPKYSYYFI
jgi:hypothetical protein